MDKKIVSASSALEVLLDKKRYQSIKEILSSLAPADIAIVFKDLESEKIPLLFRLLPKDLAADVFVEMESDDQELLIKHFSDAELKEVINELYVDDAVDIVEEMPASVVKRILRASDPDMRKEINEILKYPENSAGSIMTTEYISLKPDMTIIDAINFFNDTVQEFRKIYRK